jgi:hypothetical protein
MDNATAERIRDTLPLLNEKQRRLYLANEAKAIGRGGIKAVHEVSGVSRVTIIKGLKEIKEGNYSVDRLNSVYLVSVYKVRKPWNETSNIKRIFVRITNKVDKNP